MKIGFDAKRYYHNSTGLGNYSRTLIAILDRYCPDIMKIPFDEKSIKRSFHLGRKASASGCDIFHGLSNEIPFDIHKSGIRSIVTIHDICWRTFPEMYKPIDRKLYDIKYGWSARNADIVLSISDSTTKDLVSHMGIDPVRIKRIYQPVNELFYNKISKDNARSIADKSIANLPAEYVLYVGSINSRKNLLSILKALSSIPSDNRPPLVVVGKGKEYKNICQQYAEANLSSSGIIWSEIDDNYALQAIYSCASALVYPSFYEGFGLPVVESLLQGTPVITSNLSSLPEAAGPGAILVDPYSVEQIAEAINTVLNNTEVSQKLSIDGEEYCRTNFNPESIANELKGIYNTLLL